MTPAHIVPEWYLLPFYAILRAIPSKLGGVIAMFAALLVLFVIPWLDTSRVRSARYRPMYKVAFWLFVVTCIVLGWLGAQPAEGVYVTLARVFTLYYFAFFLVLMPILGLVEKPKPLPNSIADSVLDENDGLPDPRGHTWVWGGNRPRGRRLPRLGERSAATGAMRPSAAPAAPEKD